MRSLGLQDFTALSESSLGIPVSVVQTTSLVLEQQKIAWACLQMYFMLHRILTQRLFRTSRSLKIEPTGILPSGQIELLPCKSFPSDAGAGNVQHFTAMLKAISSLSGTNRT